jgi:hypothetical protein
VTSVASVARYHPFEVTYFNPLVGGLPGATRMRVGRGVLDFEPRDYWGSSLRPALRWANENLPEGATVTFGIPPRLYDAYVLRPDLVRVEADGRAPGGVRYVVFLNRERWFDELETDALAHGALVHAESACGVPLAMIYRLSDAPHDPP